MPLVNQALHEKILVPAVFSFSKKRALPLEGNYVLQAHIIFETKAAVCNATQLSFVASLAIELLDIMSQRYCNIKLPTHDKSN